MTTGKRLGKGIGALIPEFPEGIEQIYSTAEIDLAKIKLNPQQPRKEFGAQAMAELIMSIREKGVIQPITVRQLDDGFELIAGERRLRACQELGKTSIPAYIIPVSGEAEMLELSLIENVQREDLNPVDEARAYQMLSNTFDLSHEEIARKVGKERPTITNSLRLLNLPETILNDLRAGELSAGHARPLLAIGNPQQQFNLWQKIKRDGLSVREVEKLAKKIQESPLVEKAAASAKTPDLKKIEEKLMHILGTKVKIKGGEVKGQIAVEFYSRDDLARLLELFESIEEK
ncbi:MAG: ParB/RepB/Spo0J family partition protein [Candidatus Marinimicrobia bacterium]|jgi:ParB family chromosome partitioning protein|nr:ParB/RepB/Spo0J family partition protein [Candidatus Neomarinimicrobiota bacterium]MCK9483079.1 ParB/RepB/Spo0J family partition protein [Candidatus Neomarinimicrobiota bacterium]MCK9559234.1 ParB/RepB/Spo0J family partition protein [Candidatus Neomarinimicrobiota bacterium]MDD5061269.1 ParB/RepB/Spo0J family partition protein [Candidatus Neomarinimicrobiota bacterium]MDD5230106.1 ParB/RepB/Spo0J family partition protein [Candidatus Neomarinimicrobiota bacterium]